MKALDKTCFKRALPVRVVALNHNKLIKNPDLVKPITVNFLKILNEDLYKHQHNEPFYDTIRRFFGFYVKDYKARNCITPTTVSVEGQRYILTGLEADTFKRIGTKYAAEKKSGNSEYKLNYIKELKHIVAPRGDKKDFICNIYVDYLPQSRKNASVWENYPIRYVDFS